LGVEKVIYGGGYIDFYPIISQNVGSSHCFSTPVTIECVEKVINGGDFIDLCPKIPPYLGVPHRFSGAVRKETPAAPKKVKNY